MRCPRCRTELAKPTVDGTPMIRTRGLLLKSGQLVFCCPSCKSDVPTGIGSSALALLLFPQGSATPKKS